MDPFGIAGPAGPMESVLSLQTVPAGGNGAESTTPGGPPGSTSICPTTGWCPDTGICPGDHTTADFTN